MQTKTNIDLSILICSVFERSNTFLPSIWMQLRPQVTGLNNVEEICFMDDQKISIGEKRNKLIEAARGKYVVFVDDDDQITFDYIESLLKAIKQNPDVICFQIQYYHNNYACKKVIYSNTITNEYADENYYYRRPNHLMCFKKDIAKSRKYKNISRGEDAEWSAGILHKLKHQIIIPKVLYHYYFNTKTTLVKYD